MRVHHVVPVVSLLLIAACTAPPGGNDGGDLPPALDATQSSVTVDRPGGVTADGEDRVIITVTVKDTRGNPMPGQLVQLEASGSDNVLVQPSVPTDAQGRTTGTLATTRAETKTVRASVGGTALTQSATVKFQAGTAARLSFVVQPSHAVAGAPMSPAVQVGVLDASGNIVIDSTAQVTLSLGNNATGATLSGTLTATASGGYATFPDLSLNKLGTGYTLVSSSPGLASATSGAFNVASGAAAKLVFTVHPTNVTAGATIAPAVQVSVVDTFGNLVRNSSDVVTLALGANPGNSTLGGTLSAPAVEGVATFSDLSLTRSGQSYTLLATAVGITSATSASFNVLAAAPSKLSFNVQPSNGAVAVDLMPAVEVAVTDAFGNPVASATASITLTLGANPGGATLSGGAAQPATAGVATFAQLRISEPGTGYTLVAASPGLTSATSNPFDVAIVSGAKLVFTAQPTDVVAGQAINPAVVVTMQDANGNVVTKFSGTVTVGLGANSGGSMLSGTTTVGAANGVATFSDLVLNKSATGYTLQASAAGATGATSVAFKVTPAAANKLAFLTQPSDVAAGASMSPTVQVAVRDAFDNTVTSATNAITLSIDTNPAGATLSGATTSTASAGVASFATLKLDKAGTGYTLKANATGLTSAVSTAFDVTPGAATKLTFTTQPTNVTAGQPISPAVVVSIEDGFGNTVTNATDAVTIALASPSLGAALGGTKTVNAQAGAASFPDLTVDKAGTAYKLTATAPGLTAATSATFDVTAGPAAVLAFVVAPQNSPAGTNLSPPVQVAIQDSLGNTVATATHAVTLALGTNPSAGALSGTTTVTATSGVATFSSVQIDKPGQGYTLVASSTGLQPVTSPAFDITVGAPAKLAFTVQPSTAVAGASIHPAVQVTVQDAYGNTVPTATTAVTLAIGTNPAGGSLSGSATQAAVSGVATFSGLSIDKAASGYTLVASATGLAGATSSTFAITAGAPVTVAFTVQPSNAAAGVALSPPVELTLMDAYGNVATNATHAITVSIGTNPAGGTLTGTLTKTPSSGVAKFSDLKIDHAASGYTLQATAAGLSVAATSNAFAITAGAPARVVFGQQPSNAVAGAVVSPAITVKVQDSQGNDVPTATNAITVSLGTNGYAAQLGGTTTVSASSGVATFGNLTLNRVGAGYTLVATANGLSSATSTPFDITGPWVQNLAGGRVNAVAIHPSNAAAQWAGTANGLFRSSDSGATWSLTGPALAEIRALAIETATPTYLYVAGSTGQGASALLKSSDGGASWSQVTFASVVNHLAVDHTTTPALWVGAADGLHRSIDRGATFTRLAYVQSQSPAVAAIALDPTNSQVAYVGTNADFSQNRLAATVSKTSNAGATWGSAAALGTSLEVRGIAVDATAPSVVWAVTENGVYRSVDGGGSFTLLGSSPSAGRAIALPATTGNTVYVGNDTALFMTTNAGGTWTQAQPWSARAISVAPSAPGTVLAGARHGVLGTTDSGQSWTRSTVGLVANTVLSMAAGALQQMPDVVLAGTAEGVYRSTDLGLTWSWPQQRMSASALVVSSWQTVYAVNADPFAAPGSLLWSADGVTFQDAHAPMQIAHVIATGTSGNSNYVVVDGPPVGNDTPIFYADGVTPLSIPNWQQTAQPLPASALVGLAVVPTMTTPAIYACAGSSSSGGLWMLTSPTASSWQAVTNVPAPCDAIAVDLVTSGGPFIYVSAGGTVWRGTNPTDFMPMVGATPSEPVLSLAVAPPAAMGDAILYLGTTAGVYRSEFGQAVPASVGISDLAIHSLVAPSANVVFAGTAGRGAYRTATGGL